MTNEDRLQAACVKWFRLQYPQHVIFAIPNGGNRNAVTGAMLKRTGVLAGVADLCVLHANKHHHGLYVELKVGRNKQTGTQIDFQQACYREGYAYTVLNNIDDFMLVINYYFAPENNLPK
jgi:hypothetical protein